MTKRCFRCGKTKHIDKFYKHSSMADGHLGKCKACTKRDVHTRYHSPDGNRRVRAYERRRWQDPERRQRASVYQRNMRRNSPGHGRARNKVNNALRDGRLKRQPCWCGSTKTEAHHTDYRRPLVVVWLCRKHHLELEAKQSWS